MEPMSGSMNGYLSKEFTYDIHPPLGKLLLAGIAHLAGQYDGSFGFEEIGDAYGDKAPYIAMRTTMAVLGALCAPMAYVTLRNKGQSAPTAILATLLVALDNSLVANNRLISLEAPLMFITALSFMSWTMFTNQSQRPFGAKWWFWLLLTGLASSGAISTKLPGALTVLAMGIMAVWDLWGLVKDESFTTPVWSDIVFGSVVQLQSESQPPMYVHSPFKSWPKGSKQLQVAAYEYPDLSNHWIVIRANITKSSKGKDGKAIKADEGKEDVGGIPAHLRYLEHGDLLRLRHVAHHHCLHSHDVRTIGRKSNKRHCEVSAYGSAADGFDGDQGDWWRVEVVNTDIMRTVSKKVKGLRVKTLETAFRLKHVSERCHLHLTGDLLPEDVPGGQVPAETELVVYPKVLFWKKFKEIHMLIKSRPRAFDMSNDMDVGIEPIRPLSWPFSPLVHQSLCKVNEFETSDRGHVRQISLVPNSVSWVIRTVGLVLFFGFRVLSLLRYQRRYVDGQDLKDFKEYHLSNAGFFFTAWAAHFLPFILLKNSPSIRLNYSDYFPALYFGVLMSYTILSGIMKLSAMPHTTRAGMWVSLAVIAISTFIQLSSLSYGTLMSPQRCESIAAKINPVKIPDPGYTGVAMDTKIPLIQSTLKPDCATWKQHLAETPISPSNYSIPETFAQFKNRTELHVSKPIPRKRPPFLEPDFPPAEKPLPMPWVFMTPCQRPPQLWEVNEQLGRPNPFQRQQMQHVLKKMEQEAAEGAATKAERQRVAEEEELTRRKAAEAAAEQERVRLEKESLDKERLDKERLEKERLEKERLDNEELKKERLERETEEKAAAEEEEREWRRGAEAFQAEEARLRQIEADKQQAMEAMVLKIRMKHEVEVAERQQLEPEKKARELELAKAEEAERAAKNPMPSRKDHRERFFERAEKVRQKKLDDGFQFESGERLPPELAMLKAVMDMAGQGAGGSQAKKKPAIAAAAAAAQSELPQEMLDQLANIQKLSQKDGSTEEVLL
ncbi:hypothetical protein BGX23_001012 [Mortierella sp. AD031]|nr:hypothetical protein BGX23_001012 [Mortierella sp. AD031]